MLQLLVELIVGLIVVARVGAVRVSLAMAYRNDPPDLWQGETTRLAGPAFLRAGSAGAPMHRGWLCLTDLRLLWTPSSLSRGRVPDRVTHEPLSLRLTHIEGAEVSESGGFLRDGIHLEADGRDYYFYFKHPAGFLAGGATSSSQWLSALAPSA